MAQEFHISVTPLGEDEYLVRIERVAPGVPLAEEQVHWPVEHWLTQARQLMNDPLLGLLQGGGALAEDVFFLSEWDEPANASTRNLVELGQELYNALFQGSLRDSWMMAQAIAQNQRQVLRLRLGLKGTRLPRLPWEVMHAGDRPLATGIDVAFSRYQLSPGLWNPNQRFLCSPNQPLKILMVISGPSDQDMLELAQEASHLQEELQRRTPNGPPAIQLTVLEQPGREQLTQALEQGQYQVFHYAGHSNLGDSGGDVYLVSNRTGLTETLNGDDLAGLLVNNGVQLAVFNSCRGAYTATSKAVENGKERNLAEALVKRGIPGVLAMAERIPDEVALTLTRLLYRNLNQGYPIDLSLSRARQGLISAYGSNQLYWALPVLYLHPEFDGFLSNDTQEKREELFVISELPDPPLVPKAEDIIFTRSARPPLPPDDEDELDSFFQDLNASDDPDAEDPADFIRGLLNQIEPSSPPNSEVARPNIDAEHGSRNRSEAASWELSAHASDSTPASHRESISASSGATGTSSAQPDTRTSTTQVVEHTPSKNLTRGWQKLRAIPRVWLLIGAMGALAIALLGFLALQSRNPKIGDVTQQNPSIPTLPTTEGTNNVAKLDTPKVTALAIEQFSQGNIAPGLTAVEELLNREALPPAEAALGAVPIAKLDDPAVSFLRGRLAWQSLKKEQNGTGSKNYDLSDARKYWEMARKGQPKSVPYLSALGFAYYTEGNYGRANNAWFEALQVITASQSGGNVAPGTPNRETLNIYAGLALGLRQEAQKQPAAQRASLLSKSLNMRQYVMSNDPVNFQPDALSKNWLWTEKAIQDWRSLLAAK